MRIMNLFSQDYLDWDEYQDIIQQREEVHFMHNTAIQSLKNKTQKEDEEQ